MQRKQKTWPCFAIWNTPDESSEVYCAQEGRLVTYSKNAESVVSLSLPPPAASASAGKSRSCQNPTTCHCWAQEQDMMTWFSGASVALGRRKITVIIIIIIIWRIFTANLQQKTTKQMSKKTVTRFLVSYSSKLTRVPWIVRNDDPLWHRLYLFARWKGNGRTVEHLQLPAPISERNKFNNPRHRSRNSFLFFFAFPSICFSSWHKMKVYCSLYCIRHGGYCRRKTQVSLLHSPAIMQWVSLSRLYKGNLISWYINNVKITHMSSLG